MSKILLTGSDDAIKQMICNAINASSPMGLGIIHYKPGDVKPADLRDVADMTIGGMIDVDYFQGRMVKVRLRRDDDRWTLNAHHPPRPDYQSWCGTYPTWEALAASAGITVTALAEPEE